MKKLAWAYHRPKQASENKPQSVKRAVWAYRLPKEASPNKPKSFKRLTWAYGDLPKGRENKVIGILSLQARRGT